MFGIVVPWEWLSSGRVTYPRGRLGFWQPIRIHSYPYHVGLAELPSMPSHHISICLVMRAGDACTLESNNLLRENWRASLNFRLAISFGLTVQRVRPIVFPTVQFGSIPQNGPLQTRVNNIHLRRQLSSLSDLERLLEIRDSAGADASKLVMTPDEKPSLT
ncbi:hypothetical protein ABW19_dt0208080 [Dactylella cylindrospora]|nr:hypothetical protein ABW19_dt0208080 [Dactylella cylindrospora]